MNPAYVLVTLAIISAFAGGFALGFLGLVWMMYRHPADFLATLNKWLEERREENE